MLKSDGPTLHAPCWCFLFLYPLGDGVVLRFSQLITMSVVWKCIRLFIAVINTCEEQRKGRISPRSWFLRVPRVMAVRIIQKSRQDTICHEFRGLSLGVFPIFLCLGVKSRHRLDIPKAWHRSLLLVSEA